MVSYCNTLPYSQKHSSSNFAYASGQWQWPGTYHTPPNHQFLGDMDSPHPPPHPPHPSMYYNPHMFPVSNSSASDWHSPTSPTDSFMNVSGVHHMLHHQSSGGGIVSTGLSAASSASSGTSSTSTSAGPNSANGQTQLNDSLHNGGSVSNNKQHHIAAEGLPSPPITVSGSEISSPGAPASSSSPHHVGAHLSNNNNNSPSAPNHNTKHGQAIAAAAAAGQRQHSSDHSQRESPMKTQYFEWMKKPTYPSQPAPGKTRTKDKYRVVYTDYQRLELEKEYCTSRYITIRRKTELAQMLSLSERQVKIWFQNRRAKERKQNKKQNITDYPDMMDPKMPDLLVDTKPKLDHNLHLQHSIHSMAVMAMSGHPHYQQHPMALTAAAAVHHTHHMHHPQMSSSNTAAAATGVGALGI